MSYQNEELTLTIEQLQLRRPGELWLIPRRFDDCDIPDLDIGGGRTLASIQRVDLFGDHFRDDLRRLLATVHRILSQHSARAASAWTAAAGPGRATGPANLSASDYGALVAAVYGGRLYLPTWLLPTDYDVPASSPPRRARAIRLLLDASPK